MKTIKKPNCYIYTLECTECGLTKLHSVFCFARKYKLSVNYSERVNIFALLAGYLLGEQKLPRFTTEYPPP